MPGKYLTKAEVKKIRNDFDKKHPEVKRNEKAKKKLIMKKRMARVRKGLSWIGKHR